jgi:hypothetical protein
VCIEPVVLLTALASNSGDHDLLHVRAQDLVEPGALGSLLEAEVLVLRDHPDCFDQGSPVGLHHGRLQALASLRDHGERRACCVDVQSDIAFHRCLLSLEI